ncbi:YdcH family protein [Sphingomonas sp. ac-8]|uniref:YdcH family protein n=1 Tax=Sphingomonas sp. ac-8 TaxID=3242977 RepID=UPI003A80470A
MQTAHLAALEAKHAALDSQILAEARRPAPDQEVLATLKKRKLQIKQEITAE